MATTINSGYANSPKLTANIADHADVYGGRALVFDGVSDYLVVPDINMSAFTEYWSFSMWFNADTVSGNQYLLTGAIDSSNIWGIRTTSTTIGITNYVAGRGTYVSKTGTFLAGSWTHIVGIINGGNSNLKFYINGEEQSGTTSLDSLSNNTNIAIGSRSDTSANSPYNGKMSDVKIFNTALTEAQVQELYKKPESNPSNTTQYLERWYPMIEGNPESPQSIVYDHSEKKLGAEELGTWTNNPSYSWDTFTSSGTSITSAISDASGVHIATNPFLSVSGSLYKITFNLTLNSGTVPSISIRETVDGTIGDGLGIGASSEGVNTYYFKASSTKTLYMFFNITDTTSNWSASDVSIKEVLMGNHATTNFFGDDLVTNGTFDTDANWTKGTGWTIDVSDSNKAECDGTQTGNTNLQQNDLFTVGKTYQITFDLTRTAGNFRLLVGSSGSSGYYTTNATHTYTGVATGNGHLYLQGDARL